LRRKDYTGSGRSALGRIARDFLRRWAGYVDRTAVGTLIVSHKVKDYRTWRPVFDRHISAQKSAGLTNPRVFHSLDDKNEVVILFDTDDTKKNRDFVASPDLRDTMAEAGVVDRPTFYFLESAEPSRAMGTGWIELLGLHGVDEANE